MRKDIAKQMARKYEGMFLWIEMQQDELLGAKNQKQLEAIVNSIPEGLIKTISCTALRVSTVREKIHIGFTRCSMDQKWVGRYLSIPHFSY